MNKFHKLLLFFGVALIGFQSCTDIDDTINVPQDKMVQNFVWKGLNLYYLWKDEVPDLSDNKFSDQDQLNNYLYTKGTPEELFQDLLFKPVSKFPNAGEATDRFSVMVKDYNYLENLFQGKYTDNGMDFKLYYKDESETDLFALVRYVIPNSDAASKGVQRGHIFSTVDGIPLTINNYKSLLIDKENYTINLADYDGGKITPNGNSINLTKTQLIENPIFHHSIIPLGSHKVAYLMYNSFISNYDSQLNTVFGNFAADGATDLVLDLRYNGGGSVQSAVYLASMITGQFNGQLFAKEKWNNKVQAYYEANSPKRLDNVFTNKIGNGTGINSLNLSTVYILTSKGTASASELIINGLRPYINVIQIGDSTIGKNAGSITLYDSPRFTKTNRNPKHTYAMQPLVFKMTNKAGFGEYENGLIPTEELKEKVDNMGQLGDVNEPLLSKALSMISGSARMIPSPKKTFREFRDSKSMKPFGTDMYRDIPEELIEPLNKF